MSLSFRQKFENVALFLSISVSADSTRTYSYFDKRKITLADRVST